MTGNLLLVFIGVLGFLSLGGVYFAFAGAGSEKAKKRMATVVKSTGRAAAIKGGTDQNQQRRKNVQTMLKELEKQNAQHKKRPSLRRQIEQAGLEISIRTFWIFAIVAGFIAAVGAAFSGQPLYMAPIAGFTTAFGLPRWVLSFLRKRREKAFTREFATAIDVIVRSVKSGLPVNEALKVVASDIPQPVSGEFKLLNEGLRVGVTMEDGLKRMYERMPTTEVNFFAIVMAIQAKAGGNLSEALGNLAGVLRDRKRLEGKIRAMSSEAKAGASIIGSLPPGVATLIYVSTPDYIAPLFSSDMGRLMLMGCAVWMTLGILVMKKMISFKY